MKKYKVMYKMGVEGIIFVSLVIGSPSPIEHVLPTSNIYFIFIIFFFWLNFIFLTLMALFLSTLI